MQNKNCLKNHDIYMQRCLELAKNGMGKVEPNPLVGAVVVHDNRIIGEGFHQRFGKSHAEVIAINSVIKRELLRQSRLYVNLEPCAHQGKTPPCTDLIIKEQIPNVIIGTSDPNSLVAGRGIKKLRNAGVNVTLGVLENNCYDLNRRFFTFHKNNRPYVILKWAETKDGFIDLHRQSEEEIGINWITSETSRTLVHRWRSEEQGILSGTNTVLKDDPKLTNRNWGGKNPTRIILDRNLRIPESRSVYNTESRTLVYNSKFSGRKKNIEFIRCDFDKNNLTHVLDDLYRRGVISLLVEGGKTMLEYCIQSDLWDEIRVFIGNIKFGEGIKSPDIRNFIPIYKEKVAGDLLKVILKRSDKQ